MTKSVEMKEVALQILSYLVKNPNAKDSLSGISRWWTSYYAKTAISQVTLSSVLDYLESEKLLISDDGIGLNRQYRINDDKITEINELLKHRRRTRNPG
jgi:DNA-binding transcriptional ArsR family regulator